MSPTSSATSDDNSIPSTPNTTYMFGAGVLVVIGIVAVIYYKKPAIKKIATPLVRSTGIKEIEAEISHDPFFR